MTSSTALRLDHDIVIMRNVFYRVADVVVSGNLSAEGTIEALAKLEATAPTIAGLSRVRASSVVSTMDESSKS